MKSLYHVLSLTFLSGLLLSLLILVVGNGYAVRCCNTLPLSPKTRPKVIFNDLFTSNGICHWVRGSRCTQQKKHKSIASSYMHPVLPPVRVQHRHSFKLLLAAAAVGMPPRACCSRPSKSLPRLACIVSRHVVFSRSLCHRTLPPTQHTLAVHPRKVSLFCQSESLRAVSYHSPPEGTVGR